ncbi:hypothetical protein REB14_03525 [Chryseobacterium sp. ES2]|uniref:Uncharacterized protein n=1 Tax=Chryseobacterium metallicongregator TaxID=3073042 RepID=A0ABU1E0G4_9FLAO|nr:hypothetical protein [Chryseobacterium sp. ES2]MDR4951255.1 hypothetical protein [Chryseobacterium sp. ES2]
MSITYYDFKNLSKESQHRLVSAEGVVISETYKDKLKFVLYKVSSFSVEIVYNVTNEKIEGLNVFQNSGTYEK